MMHLSKTSIAIVAVSKILFVIGLAIALDLRPAAFVLLLFGALSLTAFTLPTVDVAHAVPIPRLLLVGSVLVLVCVIVLNRVLQFSILLGTAAAAILLVVEYQVASFSSGS